MYNEMRGSMDTKEKNIFYKGHTVLEAVILNTVMICSCVKDDALRVSLACLFLLL